MNNDINKTELFITKVLNSAISKGFTDSSS